MAGVMTFDRARNVKRPTIRVGRRYWFYSTVHDARAYPFRSASAATRVSGAQNEPLIRSFTGQRVLVVDQTFKPGHPEWCPGESERLYRVRAEDGTEFEAYQGELNGWFKDTGQFYGPSGIWGKEN